MCLLAACIGVVAGVLVGGCAAPGGAASEGQGRSADGARAASVRWAVAIHGGAGTIDPGEDPVLEARYRASLAAALDDATARLERGEAALEVVEAVVRRLEDDELFNAGRGAALTADGRAELDAAIMDGASLRAGAVAGVTTVKNPVSLARRVMERTRFILLAGEGAERFARETGVELVEPGYFVTPRRVKMLEEWRARQAGTASARESGRGEEDTGATPVPPAARMGTVGCVARDQQGRLAAATSTGGLTGKPSGRVGDSPQIGAGTYASPTAAVSCTGSGEEYIRHAVAASLVRRMEWRGESVEAAGNALIFGVLKKDDGGLIAVDAAGRVAMPFSTVGMYRAAGDSTGWRAVKIFAE